MFGRKKAEGLRAELIGGIGNHEHGMLCSACCALEQYKADDAKAEYDAHYHPGVSECFCIEYEKITF